jgi:adenylate cyclase
MAVVNSPPSETGSPALVRRTGEFFGEVWEAPEPEIAPPANGVLRTILFTDIVHHTQMMDRLGDQAGRQVLRDHERITRETLRRFQGHEVKTVGDSFMASFESVTQALHCASALQRAFAARNEGAATPIEIRIGVNAGEPIAEDDDLFGASVIAAARIKDQAGAGQIHVANVVRELVAGKGFLFADLGEQILRGLEDAVRVYELRWE